MKEKLILVYVFFSSSVAFAQSEADEVKRMQVLATKNEALAKQNEAWALATEERLRRMRYYVQAVELAEQSVETEDKELSSLLAMLAYNFNTQSGNTPFHRRIYYALVNALKKNDLLSKDFTTDVSNIDNTKNTSTFLPNGRVKVIAEPNGNLRFINESGLTVRILGGHRAEVDQIRFSHDGKLMATSGKDNTIRIWNLTQLNLRPLVISDGVAISGLGFSNDDSGVMYTTASAPKTVIWQSINIEKMAAILCNSAISRNLTKEEWTVYAEMTYHTNQSVVNNFPHESRFLRF